MIDWRQQLLTWQARVVEYWEGRTSQERLWLSVSGCLLGIYLGYSVFYLPLEDVVDQAQLSITGEEATIQWLKSMRTEMALYKHLKRKSVAEVMSEIHQTLAKNDLLSSYPYQLKQGGTGSITLSFTQVPFNAFIQWAADFDAHTLFQVEQLRAEHTERAGVVKLTWTIVLPGH